MRAVVTRVNRARVTRAETGEVLGEIGKGFLVLLGVHVDDTEKEAAKIADRICGLRVFDDENGKMNRSLLDLGGSVLAISQFTLYGDCVKGRRPGFDLAARPELAEGLYEKFVELLRAAGVHVETGRFGADMLVEIHNDGPVTFLLESRPK